MPNKSPQPTGISSTISSRPHSNRPAAGLGVRQRYEPPDFTCLCGLLPSCIVLSGSFGHRTGFYDPAAGNLLIDFRFMGDLVGAISEYSAFDRIGSTEGSSTDSTSGLRSDDPLASMTSNTPTGWPRTGHHDTSPRQRDRDQPCGLRHHVPTRLARLQDPGLCPFHPGPSRNRGRS